MKLKKLSGLLSAVLAGAMVLSMAPAAFAAATEGEHTEYEPTDSTHHNVVHYEADGTRVVWSNDVSCTFEYNAQGTYVGTESGTFCICRNEKAAEPVEEPGTTYIPVDATHHRVHTVDENGKVTYNEVAACVFETGTCVCGNTCPHSTFKYENNGDGTHKVICADCNAVVTEAAACVYGDDGNGTCVCGATKPEEVGTTYTVIDATHHHVHAVYEGGTVYDADVPCVFETGTCVCGNTCPHSTFKYENNGNGTHKVICAECGAVVTEATECVYGEDGKGTCACGAKYTCDHMKNNWKYVNNGNSTHNVVCADCGAVVSANVACNYKNGVCITCGAKQSECNHMGNHWKYVKNGNGTHNVVCADCGAVVSANVACNYENGVCITCGAKRPAATKPGHGTIDPNFGVGYHPICEFFRAVFRFLFGRH